MDYSNYSKESFDGLGINSDEARNLANALEDDVLDELHQEIMKAFEIIANRLNDQGHDLKPYGVPMPGDYSYRGQAKNGNCGLRLACDVVISSGYSHTVEHET